MTVLRRRVLRQHHHPTDSARHQLRLARRREQLQKEQAGLVRWMSRLKRAFHELEKQQAKVSRLEREINKLSGE